MTATLYKLEDRQMIYFPHAFIDWLGANVGPTQYKYDWLFDNNVPAMGAGWRVVKLYQRLGDGSLCYTFYIEFENPTDLIHFKLVWG